METSLTRAISVIPKPIAPPLGEAGPDRINAVPVSAPPSSRFEPSMGQAGPQPVPIPPAPVVPSDKTAISLADVRIILAGLAETLRLYDGAKETGWTCAGVSEAVFYQGRVLRDRLAHFVASAKPEDTLEISKAEVDAADKILACSNEATASTPNTSAYIALGVVVAGAAIFLSLV